MNAKYMCVRYVDEDFSRIRVFRVWSDGTITEFTGDPPVWEKDIEIVDKAIRLCRDSNCGFILVTDDNQLKYLVHDDACKDGLCGI